MSCREARKAMPLALTVSAPPWQDAELGSVEGARGLLLVGGFVSLTAGRPLIDLVEQRSQPTSLNLLGLVMVGTGQFPSGKPVKIGVVMAPPKAPTIQYGEYILSYHDCRECHGQQLTGGVQGQWAPVGPRLSLVADWSREQFMTTLRTGKDPSGHELDETMNWRTFGKMDDDELGAIYEYLTYMPSW
jgi:hypothetical protein